MVSVKIWDIHNRSGGDWWRPLTSSQKGETKLGVCQCSMASAINMRQVTQNDAILEVKSDMVLCQYELIIMIYYYYTTRSIWYCMTVYEEPRGTGWACSISCQISFSASSGSPESAIKKLRHSIEWSLYGIEQPAILAKELFHHPLPPWGVELVLAEEMKNATAASSGIAVTPSSNFNSSGSLHALQLPTKSSSCRRGLSGLLPPSSPIPMILCKELRLKIKQKTQEDCRILAEPLPQFFQEKLPLFWIAAPRNFPFFLLRLLGFLSMSVVSSCIQPNPWAIHRCIRWFSSAHLGNLHGHFTFAHVRLVFVAILAWPTGQLRHRTLGCGSQQWQIRWNKCINVKCSQRLSLQIIYSNYALFNILCQCFHRNYKHFSFPVNGVSPGLSHESLPSFLHWKLTEFSEHSTCFCCSCIFLVVHSPWFRL